MDSLAPIIAGLAYFILGGLWFTPLFGKAWDKAVGFNRPAKWRPAPAYYIGPLVGCLFVAFALSFLMQLSDTDNLTKALTLGAVCGVGFSAAVTGVNAISPNVPRPYMYALVVGSYHVAGALLCTLIIFEVRSRW